MQPQIRVECPAIIPEKEIEQHLQEGKQVIVQFGANEYTAHHLDKLNELCARYDDSFCIRFYGSYEQSFDCSVVNRLPYVKALSIDCLTRAHNIEAITKLTNLQRLSIGIHEMKETELLSAENLQQLKELFIFDTKTRTVNLEYLSKYHNLSSLIICGHTKNIDAVGTLAKLKSLRLNSISKAPLHFVNALKALQSLSIILGGRDNIQEIGENEIEELELVWIRGLNDLSNIGNFKKLKTLSIQDQIRLPHIQFDRALPALRDLKVLNCKTLSSVSGLENLPALEELWIYKTNIDFEQFIKQPLPPLLKILAFYTTKSKVDSQLKTRVERMGYTDGLKGI